MGKGGGGGGGTNWQDIAIENNKRQEREANQLREDQRAAAAENARYEDFKASLSRGSTNLRNKAYRDLAMRGLDAREYGGIVDEAIDAKIGSINSQDVNPGAQFTDSIVDEALGRARDTRRQKFTNDVTSKFQPGFQDNYFQSNADDAFIDDVIGRQRGDAVNYVERARSRGQLDDTGYQAALGRISEMERTGRATANTLGDAVLQGNRSRLADIGNNAKAAAGSWDLGQNFDLGQYTSQFDRELAGMNTSLQGEVLGALGGQNFFDVGDIIARAGTAQGAVNPQVEGADAIAARDKLRTLGRGTGNSGSTF